MSTVDLDRVRAHIATKATVTVRVEDRDQMVRELNPTTHVLEAGTPATIWSGKVLLRRNLQPSPSEDGAVAGGEQRATVSFPVGPVFAVGQVIVVTAARDADMVGAEFVVGMIDTRASRARQQIVATQRLPA